jgi:hypothetical protein
LQTARELPAPSFFATDDFTFAADVAAIQAGDNDWLRLTSDDRFQVREFDGALRCVDFCWR